jgi:hypothetical protein
VAVEKLAHFDFAKTVSLQEALQAIFPSLLDIFYHPIFDFFGETDFFNSHRISQHLSGSRASGLRMLPRHEQSPTERCGPHIVWTAVDQMKARLLTYNAPVDGSASPPPARGSE